MWSTIYQLDKAPNFSHERFNSNASNVGLIFKRYLLSCSAPCHGIAWPVNEDVSDAMSPYEKIGRSHVQTCECLMSTNFHLHTPGVGTTTLTIYHAISSGLLLLLHMSAAMWSCQFLLTHSFQHKCEHNRSNIRKQSSLNRTFADGMILSVKELVMPKICEMLQTLQTQSIFTTSSRFAC